MKATEFKKLIRKEVRRVLNENEKYGINDPRSLDELEKAIIKHMKVKESGNGGIKVGNEINILFSIYKNKGGKKVKQALEAIAREEKLDLDKNGIYILDGGLNKSGEWDEKSLKKAKVLYYTMDSRDPKLKNFQEDGMVKVDISDGDIDVSSY